MRILFGVLSDRLPTNLPTATGCSAWKRLWRPWHRFRPSPERLPSASNGGKRGFQLESAWQESRLARARVEDISQPVVTTGKKMCRFAFWQFRLLCEPGCKVPSHLIGVGV